MPSNMPYYSEGETRRPRWKFWRSKSSDTSHSHSNPATKQSSSRSDDSYRDRDRPPKRSGDYHHPFEDASLRAGQLATTTNSSSSGASSSEPKGSPSLHPRTLSNSSIAPVEHTKSTSTSTSSPVVTRETHTDPVTGDLVITMTTTVVTTTTTRRIIKIPPATPARPGDEGVEGVEVEVDLDEERRLAAEYLASNGMQSPRDRHPGLQPAPRRSGSHSNLVGRSAEQHSSSAFGPRPHTSDRSYSMGSRTGPPPSLNNFSRNFSRPGPNKQAGEEGQTRLSLDARRGLKRGETMRSKVSLSIVVMIIFLHSIDTFRKSLILRKPEAKPAAVNEESPIDAEQQQQNYSHSIDTIALQNTQTRPHTRDGGEKWPSGQRHPTFHKPRVPHPASPRVVEDAELSPRRSWGTFGSDGGLKQQKRQQATTNFILGIPSTGGQLGNMF